MQILSCIQLFPVPFTQQRKRKIKIIISFISFIFLLVFSFQFFLTLNTFPLPLTSLFIKNTLVLRLFLKNFDPTTIFHFFIFVFIFRFKPQPFILLLVLFLLFNFPFFPVTFLLTSFFGLPWKAHFQYAPLQISSNLLRASTLTSTATSIF